MPGRRFLIFASGDCHELIFYQQMIDPDDRIICVDGGSRHVLAMGLSPFAVVGDNDSITPSIRKKLMLLKPRWIQNPDLDQEQSDLEMALKYALSLHPSELIICGAFGGTRIDHTLINLHLLMIPLQAGVPAKIVDERQTVWLLDGELTVTGQVNDYLSLFSLTPEVTGITTEGLKYPLYGETLYFASTRGLSNELSSNRARVTVDSGLLLVIHTLRQYK